MPTETRFRILGWQYLPPQFNAEKFSQEVPAETMVEAIKQAKRLMDEQPVGHILDVTTIERVCGEVPHAD